MVELEVYAAGLRNPEKMMGLALELDSIAGLRYKVDTNHDIAYLEFGGDALSLAEITAIFNKLELKARFVGVMPKEIQKGKKTLRFTA
jgi:hypothetical protein